MGARSLAGVGDPFVWDLSEAVACERLGPRSRSVSLGTGGSRKRWAQPIVSERAHREALRHIPAGGELRDDRETDEEPALEEEPDRGRARPAAKASP